MTTNEDNNVGETAYSIQITPCPSFHEQDKPRKKHEGIDDKKPTKSVLFWCGIAIFFIGIAISVVSLTIPSLKGASLGGLAMWQWSLLLTAVLGGPVVSHAISELILLFARTNKSLHAMYYVLRFIARAWAVLWFSIILLAWIWVVDEPKYLGVVSIQKEEHIFKLFTKEKKIVTLTLITIIVGTILWLVKDLLLLIGINNFHIKRFPRRIRESLMDEYRIRILSGYRDSVLFFQGRRNVCGMKTRFPLSSSEIENEEFSLSSFEMQIVSDTIIEGRKLVYKMNGEEKEIDCENEVKIAASIIFSKLAQYVGPHDQCGVSSDATVDQVVLLQALKDLIWNKEKNDADKVQIKPNASTEAEVKAKIQVEAEKLLRWLLEGTDGKEFNKKVLKKCLFRALKKRQTLIHALQSNKQLFVQLDRCVKVVLVVVIFIVWLVLLQEWFRKALLVIGGFIAGSAFLTQDFCRRLLDGFSFVFVAHPFDVGDCCLIQNTLVIIEDMDLLTTVAVTLEYEKRVYPNSMLFESYVSNYSRSQSCMGDSVVFYLDMSTPESKIKTLANRIKSHIKANPQDWQRKHELAIEFELKETESMIKATLHVNHTINYHDYNERVARRTKLILHIKKILEELNVMQARENAN